MLYEIDARQTERAFIRRFEKHQVYQTANGKANIYMGRNRKHLFLKTAKSQKALVIPRTKIRQAIQYTYYIRTLTRKDLERFSRYSSAMMGILITIFGKMSKVAKTPTGLLRLSLTGLRYFFAGVDRAVRDMEIAAAQGAKFVLMSYAHIRYRKAWKKHAVRLGLKILLDSGAFTVWRSAQAGKVVDPITVESYADFIEEHQEVLYAWFNLDVIGDAEASKRHATVLRERGIVPIEVWHIDSDMKNLEQLVNEDHPVIAIGGTVGTSEGMKEAIFKQVFSRFPNQAFHYLGGGGKLLFSFPWFSADGTGWLAGRKYGVIMHQDGQRKAEEGWTAEECLVYNVKHFSRLECPIFALKSA